LHFLEDSEPLCSSSGASAVSLEEQNDTGGRIQRDEGFLGPRAGHLKRCWASVNPPLSSSLVRAQQQELPVALPGPPTARSFPTLLRQKAFVLLCHWARHHHLPGASSETGSFSTVTRRQHCTDPAVARKRYVTGRWEIWK